MLQNIYSFSEISAAEFGSKKFICSFEVLLSDFFFHLRLMDGIYL